MHLSPRATRKFRPRERYRLEHTARNANAKPRVETHRAHGATSSPGHTSRRSDESHDLSLIEALCPITMHADADAYFESRVFCHRSGCDADFRVVRNMLWSGHLWMPMLCTNR